jgi:predicted deacylase
MSQRKRLVIGGERIRAGEVRDLRLKVSETFTGDSVLVPLRVIRARRPGPVVFVSAAIHGDEINGTGIVRELIYGEPVPLRRGTLICMPVINVFGFETHSRDMPDRRDLNRCFPGGAEGSLSSRVAHMLLEEVIRRCDFGIDLHSAAVRRTNYPNVRGDLSNPGVRALATAFGCELIVNGKGPEGSMRRAACAAGCPTIILEAGEVGKVEPSVRDVGVRGIRNILISLGMLGGEMQRPAYQVTVRKTTWVRADLGGLLRFHVSPGDLVEGGEPIATNESLFGAARSVLIAPAAGIVLGMSTHPAAKPGEPVCHLAMPGRSIAAIRRAIESAPHALHRRVHKDLATNIAVADGLTAQPSRRRH